MPRYCPRCSAFLPDPNVSACIKCGGAIHEELERKERFQAAIVRKSELVEGAFYPVTGITCPKCGENVEVLSRDTEEFQVKGAKTGSGPAGEEFALFRARVSFQKWRCQKGHMFFSQQSVEWKELCPRCRKPNTPYGGIVRSCATCNVMVPGDYYRKKDPLVLMEERGYIYSPDLK
ncbi:MAG: hypothetical protein KAH57_03540 [Thermoplasmata archaeon]|nr:hypothetical protein [Thermoplasmata archaeon]